MQVVGKEGALEGGGGGVGYIYISYSLVYITSKYVRTGLMGSTHEKRKLNKKVIKKAGIGIHCIY